MYKSNGVGTGTVVALGLLGTLLGAAPRPHGDVASQVSVKLSEWNVGLSQASVAAGPITFVITNAGSIPHGFEVEGQGIEKEIETIQPGASDTLTLTLKAGTGLANATASITFSGNGYGGSLTSLDIEQDGNLNLASLPTAGTLTALTVASFNGTIGFTSNVSVLSLTVSAETGAP